MSGNYPRNHRLLDADEELALVARAQAGDTDARNELVLCNTNLAHNITNRFFSSDPAVDYDDLVQEALLGLLHAVDKYDAQHGRRFYAYAADWMRARITRYIENNNVIRRPSNYRYADEVTQRRVRQISHVQSLDGPAGASPYYDLGEVTPDPQPAVEHTALNTVLIGQALDAQQTDAGRQALRMRLEGYTCQEIGDHLGKSRGYATHCTRLARSVLSEETH